MTDRLIGVTLVFDDCVMLTLAVVVNEPDKEATGLIVPSDAEDSKEGLLLVLAQAVTDWEAIVAVVEADKEATGLIVPSDAEDSKEGLLLVLEQAVTDWEAIVAVVEVDKEATGLIVPSDAEDSKEGLLLVLADAIFDALWTDGLADTLYVLPDSVATAVIDPKALADSYEALADTVELAVFTGVAEAKSEYDCIEGVTDTDGLPLGLSVVVLAKEGPILPVTLVLKEIKEGVA